MTVQRSPFRGPTPASPSGRSAHFFAFTLVLVLAATPSGSAASDQTLRTAGNEVVSPPPDGRDWACAPSRRAGDGFSLAEIRCRRPFGQAALLLYAKDYEGPSETVSSICGRDWKAYYRSILPSVSRLDAKVVTEGLRSVCVVDADGKSEDGSRLRLKEWYVVVPHHVLLITAAGPADVVTSQEPAVTKWRNGVVFRAAQQQ